ncbi:Ribonuclease HI [Buchnera aphidicola (Tetraneura ulmi)]
MKKKIFIFTDGSCLGNPGPGGYSAILQYKNKEKIIQSGFYLTTNNRMELMAIIFSISVLKESCLIELTTDSKYVQQGMLIWIHDWKKKNWKNKKNKKIKNIDLWIRLNYIVKKHIIRWNWIKGHSGNKNNERCHLIAKRAAKNPVCIDHGYIKK